PADARTPPGPGAGDPGPPPGAGRPPRRGRARAAARPRDTRCRCASALAGPIPNPRRSGGNLREPADRALPEPREISHVDPGRRRDRLDRRLDEVLGRVDVRLREQVEDILVDAVELE